MSYEKDGSYVVGSHMAHGGAPADTIQNVLKYGGVLVPGWTLLSERVQGAMTGDSMAKLKLGVLVFLCLMIVYAYVKVVPKMMGMSGMAGVMTMGSPTVWGAAPGPRGTEEIRLSDPNHDPKIGSDMRQAFLGSQAGPEFVEQPNYVLGNENMLRSALNQYQRLKSKGLVGDWKPFWAEWRANNSDDVEENMYDFGEGMRPGPEKASAMMKRAGVGGN